MKKNAASNLLNDYHLLSYDVLDSTNDEARRLAEGGGSHGAVIWAKRQTAGRGRMGREWVSHEGNLYVSLLLAPPCELAEASQLSFVAAVAAVETLKPLVGDAHTLSCKWPNDILLDGKKLGGILLESFRTNVGAEMQQWMIVGVGINIESFPEHTQYPATCLKASGVEIVSAKIVLSRFIYHFIQAYDLWCKKGFAPLRKQWLSAAHGVGEPVEVRLPDATYHGVFKGIEKDGQLILETAPRKRLNISAGDVFFGASSAAVSGAPG